MSLPKTRGKKFWSSKAPEALPPFPNLGKRGNRVLAIAIPTTDAHLAHLVLLVRLATTVFLAIPDNRVIQVYLATIPLFHYPPMADAVGARPDHPVHQAHQDLLAHLVPKALLAVQAVQAEMATVAHKVPQVPLEILVQQADKVRLVTPAKARLAVKKATPDPLVLLAAQADLVSTPTESAPPAETEAPAHLVHPALLVQAAVLVHAAESALQVREANPARTPNIVRAHTARRPKPPKLKLRPKPRPRPKPKPRHKPDNDDMVQFILAFDILSGKFINTQMHFILFML